MLLAMLLAAGCSTQSYFPEGSVENPYHKSDRYAKYYAKALQSFGESPLYGTKKEPIETYRFLWLRTFDNPVLIKLEIPEQGQPTLTTKVANGRSAYEFGKVEKDEKKKISRSEAVSLSVTIDESDFWRTSNNRWNPDEEGMDGAEWVIEGFRKGKYHVLTDLSPEDGIVRFIGEKLIRLSELSIQEEEYY